MDHKLIFKARFPDDKDFSIKIILKLFSQVLCSQIRRVVHDTLLKNVVDFSKSLLAQLCLMNSPHFLPVSILGAVASISVEKDLFVVLDREFENGIHNTIDRMLIMH